MCSSALRFMTSKVSVLEKVLIFKQLSPQVYLQYTQHMLQYHDYGLYFDQTNLKIILITLSIHCVRLQFIFNQIKVKALASTHYV